MSRRKGDKPRFEKLLFSVMGPAAVGDVNAPVTYVADPADALCPKCGFAWDQHVAVRTEKMTYMTCPEP